MNMHYLFVILAVACMLHTPNEFRLGGVMLAAIGMFCLDKFVTVIFRTHRIDSTLFTRLDDGTVQLDLQGACATCPAKLATLRVAIEAPMKKALKGVQSVISI